MRFYMNYWKFYIGMRSRTILSRFKLHSKKFNAILEKNHVIKLPFWQRQCLKCASPGLITRSEQHYYYFQSGAHYVCWSKQSLKYIISLHYVTWQYSCLVFRSCWWPYLLFVEMVHRLAKQLGILTISSLIRWTYLWVNLYTNIQSGLLLWMI